MSLTDPHPAAVSSSAAPLFDAVIECSVTWREESAAVTATYENWARAPRGEHDACGVRDTKTSGQE